MSTFSLKKAANLQSYLLKPHGQGLLGRRSKNAKFGSIKRKIQGTINAR